MNISETTLMYPNDKLLPMLSKEEYKSRLKKILQTENPEQTYEPFSFAVIAKDIDEVNIGKPVMIFSCEELVEYEGEFLECVSVVSEHGLTSLNINTGEKGTYFGALVPKKWLRVLSFDEVESIIGIRPLVLQYEEKPYYNSETGEFNS